MIIRSKTTHIGAAPTGRTEKGRRTSAKKGMILGLPNTAVLISVN